MNTFCRAAIVAIPFVAVVAGQFRKEPAPPAPVAQETPRWATAPIAEGIDYSQELPRAWQAHVIYEDE